MMDGVFNQHRPASARASWNRQATKETEFGRISPGDEGNVALREALGAIRTPVDRQSASISYPLPSDRYARVR